MPDLTSLELLVAIARTGSLSAAGRDLGLTQQAVSARLTKLEADTGVRLAVRTSRGATLTEAGTVVAGWADRLLRVAQEVDTGLASLRADARGQLRVVASLTVAEHLLPAWLVSLREPIHVVLHATNSDHVIGQVHAGEADLGFVEGSSAPKGLGSKVVAHDELVLVVLPEHRWARRMSGSSAGGSSAGGVSAGGVSAGGVSAGGVSPDELAGTPLVTREHGSGTREFLTTALHPRHQVPPVLELSTTASVRAAVLAGAGPAVLSWLAVADDVRTGRLRRIPLTDLSLRRELRAIWSGPKVPPAGAIRTFLAHILAQPLQS